MIWFPLIAFVAAALCAGITLDVEASAVGGVFGAGVAL